MPGTRYSIRLFVQPLMGDSVLAHPFVSPSPPPSVFTHCPPQQHQRVLIHFSTTIPELTVSPALHSPGNAPYPPGVSLKQLNKVMNVPLSKRFMPTILMLEPGHFFGFVTL
ncbi:hypothetical protein J6590_060352 [Homalodisca vitripennis]|nr:hypothetical protein J6590_060352 [Homalodisca vitripennis]